MKKLIALLLAVVMVFARAACGVAGAEFYLFVWSGDAEYEREALHVELLLHFSVYPPLPCGHKLFVSGKIQHDTFEFVRRKVQESRL